jgi:hypothetical protein
MFRKILVWGSLLFLFGSLALITYLTYFSGNSIRKSSTYEMKTSQLMYFAKRQDFEVFSIKQLDSLSAASNFNFTKVQATEYPLSGL